MRKNPESDEARELAELRQEWRESVTTSIKILFKRTDRANTLLYVIAVVGPIIGGLIVFLLQKLFP